MAHPLVMYYCRDIVVDKWVGHWGLKNACNSRDVVNELVYVWPESHPPLPPPRRTTPSTNMCDMNGQRQSFHSLSQPDETSPKQIFKNIWNFSNSLNWICAKDIRFGKVCNLSWQKGMFPSDGDDDVSCPAEQKKEIGKLFHNCWFFITCKWSGLDITRVDMKGRPS